MPDVNYCPNCGSAVPETATDFSEDLVLNRYRTHFKCVECWYHGELFRHETSEKTEQVRDSEVVPGEIGGPSCASPVPSDLTEDFDGGPDK